MKFEHKPAVTEVVTTVVQAESFDFSVGRDTAERLRALLGAVSVSSMPGDLGNLYVELSEILDGIYRVVNSPSRNDKFVSLKFERKVT